MRVLCLKFTRNLYKVNRFPIRLKFESTLLRASSPRICSRPTHPVSSIKATQCFNASKLKTDIKTSAASEKSNEPEIIVPCPDQQLMETFIPITVSVEIWVKTSITLTIRIREGRMVGMAQQ